MSIKRYNYHSGPTYSFVTAWEYSKAALKAAFQIAVTGPHEHPGYNAFHSLHTTINNLHRFYKKDILA